MFMPGWPRNSAGEAIVTENDSGPMDRMIPAEVQQELPRKIRLAGRGVYYLLGSVAVSVLILTLAVMVFSKTAKDVRNGRELASGGQLAYTGDVQAGGPHLATVYYSFIYDGTLYRGEALLPQRFLTKIDDYNKSGNFPVLFLPGDPSINHPYDWQDDESYASAFLSYVLIAIFILQWSVLGKFILRDLRLARNGVAAVGKVTKCSFGRNGGMQVRYEFRDKDGLLAEGRGECAGRQVKDAEICILFLPDDSGRNRPYPLVFFRATK